MSLVEINNFTGLIRSLAGEQTDVAAWDAIFQHFNKQRGKVNIGYRPKLIFWPSLDFAAHCIKNILNYLKDPGKQRFFLTKQLNYMFCDSYSPSSASGTANTITSVSLPQPAMESGVIRFELGSWIITSLYSPKTTSEKVRTSCGGCRWSAYHLNLRPCLDQDSS